MLYHRLLSDLISTETPFDFDALWDKLGVDSHIEFSTGFLVQAGLIDQNSGFATTTNLDGLVESWKRILEASSIADVDPKLQLIYRLQPRAGGSNGNEKGKEREASFAPNGPQPFNAEVRYNIAMEIRNSLLAAREGLGEGSSSKAKGDGRQEEENELDVELQRILYQSLVPQLPGVEEPPAEEPGAYPRSFTFPESR
jgi:exonuclease V